MKRFFLMLILSFFAVAGLSAQALPDIQVETQEGEIVSVRDLVGKKPLIICYWSIACKPCIQELNAINDQIEDWQKEATFEVVAVSVDDARLKATAKAKAASLGWEFTCIYDSNQSLKRAMNVSLTPHSFVVDKSGKIVLSHSGYTPGSEQLLIDKVVEISKK